MAELQDIFNGGDIERSSNTLRVKAFTGDVTKSAGGTALTIPNDTVTYAKMQNVSATSRVLCRKTASAGDMEEGTLSEILDFIGSAAQGDILYRGASAWARLAANTSGYVLKTNGPGANPEWTAPATMVRLDEQSPSGTGTVTFAAIPATYRHLRIEFTGRSTEVATSTVANLQFNNDTGSNYDGQRGVFSTTTTLAEQIGATSVNAILVPGASATANYASGGVIEIPYYAETTFYKTFMAKMHYLLAQTTTNVQYRTYNGIWRSTSAISEIDLVLTGGNWVAGSKLTLYGIS